MKMLWFAQRKENVFIKLNSDLLIIQTNKIHIHTYTLHILYIS